MAEGPVCKECSTFKRHKDKCWFYWDNKKACSQHVASDFSEPAFKEVREFEFNILY